MTEADASTTEAPPAEQQPCLDGHIACACGKVRLDIIQPKSSTSIVAPAAALCQCTDCRYFAQAVAKYRQECHPSTSAEAADVLLESNAVDLKQVYKSDVVHLTGEDHLHAVKLTEKSPAIRYYSTCCGTPIMMDYVVAPFFIVYQHLIHPNDKSPTPFQVVPPRLVLFHRSAPPNSPPTPEGVPVRETASLGFISYAIARIILGFVAGKKTSPITSTLAQVPVRVGLESIGKPLTPNQEQQETN